MFVKKTDNNYFVYLCESVDDLRKVTSGSKYASWEFINNESVFNRMTSNGFMYVFLKDGYQTIRLKSNKNSRKEFNDSMIAVSFTPESNIRNVCGRIISEKSLDESYVENLVGITMNYLPRINSSFEDPFIVVNGFLAECKFNRIHSAEIPDTVHVIGYGAFFECRRLTEVSIPNTVSVIMDSAFEGCSSLQNISIPSSVTSIRFSAFEGCESLTHVVVPHTVKEMHRTAFNNCSNLETLVLPFHLNLDSWFINREKVRIIRMNPGITFYS